MYYPSVMNKTKALHAFSIMNTGETEQNLRYSDQL